MADLFTLARPNLAEAPEIGIRHLVSRMAAPTSGFLDTLRAPVPGGTHSFRLTLASLAAVNAFKSWYLAQRGACRAFWLPTYHVDLPLVADLAAGAAAITIRASGYTELFFPAEARRHLCFYRPSGIGGPAGLEHRRVTDAVDHGDGTETLTLDAPLAAAFPRAGLLSFLLYVRLTDDRVRLRWQKPGHAETTLAVTELPNEVPAGV